MSISARSSLLTAASLLLALPFLLGADGGTPSAPPPAPTPTISGDEAKALVKQGALLLDVRTPAEFAEAHVDGATNIPVHELEAKLGSFPAKKGQGIVVYCKSGRRSANAAEILKKAGYTKVFDLGGMSNWK